MGSRYQKLAEDILSLAGVKINGNEPWDIQVYNKEFYRRVIFLKGFLKWQDFQEQNQK
ncbi:MAG: hypothetical protein AAB221_01285 [Bacteroidota bacterium]